MLDIKIGTPEIGKQYWDKLERPCARLVHEQMVADGYSVPSVRGIGRWVTKGGWEKAKPKSNREQKRAKRHLEKGKRGTAAKAIAAAALDGVAVAMTGNPEAKATDLAAQLTGQEPIDPEAAAAKLAAERFQQAVKKMEECRTIEEVLRECSETGIRTAHTLYALLGVVGPALIEKSPEAVGKCFQAISDGLETAMNPVLKAAAIKEVLHRAGNGAKPGPKLVEKHDPIAASFAKLSNGA